MNIPESENLGSATKKLSSYSGSLSWFSRLLYEFMSTFRILIWFPMFGQKDTKNWVPRFPLFSNSVSGAAGSGGHKESISVLYRLPSINIYCLRIILDELRFSHRDLSFSTMQIDRLTGWRLTWLCQYTLSTPTSRSSHDELANCFSMYIVPPS